MTRQGKMIISRGLLGACALLSAGTARADGTSPFIGTWHWDAAQSKLPSGESAPSDMTAMFSRVDAKHVRWSVTISNARGQSTVESYDTPANGEFYPISADTTASFRLNGEDLDGVFKGPNGASDTLRCSLSPDARKMTCAGTMIDPGGKTENYVDVYERR